MSVGLLERRRATIVARPRVGTVHHQQLDHLELAKSRRNVQWSCPSWTAQVHIHALTEQRTNFCDISGTHAVEEGAVLYHLARRGRRNGTVE